MTTNEELIGRADINDLEAILSISKSIEERSKKDVEQS